ncbi:MAG TPA: GNAT family N-acetyltransferase [Acidobacteriaceae bacterium]|nr:GNAT family N-acetyltransferase [Acidobacteriaceae bacterium]
MTSALQLEILDLRHFSAASLKALLNAESRVWSQRLEWDYRPSATLLLQYLDSRILPGFVAVENSRVSGYVFCVYEDHKAVVGDVFAILPQQAAMASVDIETQLLTNLIELLQNSPGVDRIESQLLLHPHGELARPFLTAGFSVHKRLFMRRDLVGITPAPFALPADLELRPWREGDFNEAARLISASYSGHLDSFINDQYRSTAGSLRFLHNIVRFPGCGYFDAAASRILFRRGTNEFVGLALCSRVREDVAHVTQLCVAKEERGKGLGRLLIEHAAANLKTQGFRVLTLTVTEKNENAVALYRRSDFQITHDFDAMLWEKSSGPVIA